MAWHVTACWTETSKNVIKSTSRSGGWITPFTSEKSFLLERPSSRQVSRQLARQVWQVCRQVGRASRQVSEVLDPFGALGFLKSPSLWIALVLDNSLMRYIVQESLCHEIAALDMEKLSGIGLNIHKHKHTRTHDTQSMYECVHLFCIML